MSSLLSFVNSLLIEIWVQIDSCLPLKKKKKSQSRDFPGDPVVDSTAGGMSLIPGRGLRSHMTCDTAKKLKKKKPQS